MLKRIQLFRVLPVLLLLGTLSLGKAQTINTSSCNASDVQAAFNSVISSTTTINIASGTCIWTTEVTLTVPNGSSTLSVIGAGNLSTTGGGDATVIVDSYANPNPILIINTAGASSKVRLAGITFEGGSAGSGNDKYNGIVQFKGSSQNVRVDHAHFSGATYSPALGGSMVQFNGCIYGVTDHSIFDQLANSVTNDVRTYNAGTCYSDALGIGDQSWAHSTSLGSSNFMFVENNVFNNGAGNDCLDGGRFVWRFNTMHMTSPAPSVQTHPTGSAGRIRGCRAWEIYENTFNAGSGNYINAAFWASSGTGVFWGNTIPSSTASGGTGFRNVIELSSMREDNSTYPETATPGGWGYCGKDFSGTGSNWDQNGNSGSGYHCLDQPGMGVGDLLTGGFSSDESGSNNVTNSVTNCTASQTCAWPQEAIEPIYEWADSYSPVPNNPSAVLSINGSFSNTPNFIQNTDYYLWCNASSQTGCTSFNGTVGVGSGTLASRPSTCTTGVGYWATDQGNWNLSGSGGQGELFVCNATNTWNLYYTPYTYPHPLTGTSTVSLGSPSGLNGSVALQ